MEEKNNTTATEKENSQAQKNKKSNEKASITASAKEENDSVKIQFSISNLRKLMVILTIVSFCILALYLIVITWGAPPITFHRIMRTFIWLCSGIGGLIGVYYFVKNNDKIFTACFILNALAFLITF